MTPFPTLSMTPSSESDLAMLREAERISASDGLPATVGGARRRALIAFDALSTYWTGWDLQTGAPVWLSILRPRWTSHPAMVRRFWESEAQASVRGFQRVVGDGLPTRRLLRPGATLRELAPRFEEEPVSLPLRASVLAHGLDGLVALHQQGRGVGGDVADWLLVSADGPRLVDRHAFAAPFRPVEELVDLARAVVALAPNAQDPIAVLARAWCDRPPPTALDGAQLACRAMATHLAWLRHELVRTRHSRVRGARLGRLSRLLRRLDQAQAPPRGAACLDVGPDGRQVRVWSDGQTVRGGVTFAEGPSELPVVWSADEGLDPVAGRLLIRAWSLAQDKDDRLAEREQAALGEQGVPPLLFIRWLKAARRLRSARLLLDAEARVRVIR